jgi:hypothetical protein
VQIMSPAYEADPGERKTVPRSRWYAAPAAVPPAAPSEAGFPAAVPQSPVRAG